MQRIRGFTIVELLVVIVIIGILLMLSILMISNNRANARDTERKADIENLARGLETRYKQGNSRVSAPSYVSAGSYPGANEMRHIMGVSVAGFTPAQISGGYPRDALPGTEVATFSPPSVSGSFIGFGIVCTASCGAARDAATIGSSVTKDTYYYQPIDAAGDVCIQGGCVRFQLFWREEVTGNLNVVESRRQ